VSCLPPVVAEPSNVVKIVQLAGKLYDVHNACRLVDPSTPTNSEVGGQVGGSRVEEPGRELIDD